MATLLHNHRRMHILLPSVDELIQAAFLEIGPSLSGRPLCEAEGTDKRGFTSDLASIRRLPWAVIEAFEGSLISEIVMRANVGYGKAQCGLPGRSELRQIVLETREGWQHRALAAYIRSSTELKFSDWKARKCFAGSVLSTIFPAGKRNSCVRLHS